MINVYEQVNQNKFKSGLIISLFIAFISLAVYFISRAFGYGNEYIIFALIISFFMSGVSYFWGDKIVVGLNNAKPVTRKEFFDFYTVTENLSLANDTPVPKIYVIDSPAMNAFATGRDPEHALICATTGLLEKLNRTELEAVVAHELSHIKNYDIRLMMIVSILIGTLSILINTATRASFFGGRNRDNDDDNGGIFAIIGLILIIFAPIIAQLIQLAISRRREFLADASGVKLTRQPQGLIDALQKISSDTNKFETASTATASLYISNPFKGNKIASLFSTHPPIEDRINMLKKML
ncbi:MAG: M48 family metallopeptidase [Candidatus Shapirobacteria bacterium]|nr:M48 family metallopeptidase [Candidatus Shapirobacteria bacterium]MDD4410437.1 M48 family metallopeptidase [Candidatus Shapirobacteria bacterium]